MKTVIVAVAVALGAYFGAVHGARAGDVYQQNAGPRCCYHKPKWPRVVRQFVAPRHHEPRHRYYYDDAPRQFMPPQMQGGVNNQINIGGHNFGRAVIMNQN